MSGTDLPNSWLFTLMSALVAELERSGAPASTHSNCRSDFDPCGLMHLKLTAGNIENEDSFLYRQSIQ